MVTLDESYAECRRLTREHGTTYYWAAFALPRIKRHHLWALYGFCRYADEIVDAPAFGSPQARKDALAELRERFFDDLARGRSEHPVLKAVVHTIVAFDIDGDLFRRFLDSMAMDLTVDRYQSYSELRTYMDGSASVIGEMMLPILEPTDDSATAPARALGEAFQLTNFLRDVGEDLDRGRVYLPQEDLDRFGADPWARTVDEAWVALVRFEIDRCRALYRDADGGLGALPPDSARCIAAAQTLYSEILDAIERNGYDVFTRRARVPRWRKAQIAGAALRPWR